jgi:hypothetical protein
LTSVTVTGQSGQTAGNYFQNDASYPEQAFASLAGGTISNLNVFQNTITFNVFFDLGTLPGQKIFQWSNPDGQGAAGGAITVTVPPPTVTGASPQLTARMPATEVTITGTNFYPGTVIEFAPYDTWIYAPKVTTYVNSTTVKALLTVDDLKYGGFGQIRAVNGPNVSQPKEFRVYVSVDNPAIISAKVIEGKAIRPTLGALQSLDDSYYTVELSKLTGQAIVEFTSYSMSFLPPTWTGMNFYAKLNDIFVAPTISAQIYNYTTKRWESAFTAVYDGLHAGNNRYMEVYKYTRNRGPAHFQTAYGGPYYKYRVTFSGGPRDVRRAKYIFINVGFGRIIY